MNKHNDQWSPPTWVLSLGAGLAPFAVTLVAPAIPAMAIDLKADSNIAQLVLTTLLLSIALGIKTMVVFKEQLGLCLQLLEKIILLVLMAVVIM